MKIYPNRLSEHLRQGLKPVYVISGEEQLQVNECCDAIRACARSQGFAERAVYSVDIDTNHDEFLQSADNLSLFAEKKILEIRLPRGKTGKEWARVINRYLDSPPDDTLLIIFGTKLERAVQSSAWYKKADKLGGVITAWPKKHQEILNWIGKRLGQLHLRASRSAITLIARRIEGNMLAAEQEMQKLALLYPGVEIGDAEVISAVADSSRYSVFDLSNAALDGNAARTAKILYTLRAEGVSEVLILWSVSQEIKLVSGIAQAQLAGLASDAAINGAGVARNRIGLVKKALHRHTERDWLKMLAKAIRLDRIIKGRESGEFWDEILELTLFLAGRKLELPESAEIS